MLQRDPAHRSRKERFVPICHVDGKNLAGLIPDHTLARFAQYQVNGNFDFRAIVESKLLGDHPAGHLEQKVDALLRNVGSGRVDTNLRPPCGGQRRWKHHQQSPTAEMQA